MFKNFQKEGFRTISEKQLVAELSKRAKHLCEDLEGILDINEDEAEMKQKENNHFVEAFVGCSR